jgi:hypothetical protein
MTDVEAAIRDADRMAVLRTRGPEEREAREWELDALAEDGLTPAEAEDRAEQEQEGE